MCSCFGTFATADTFPCVLLEFEQRTVRKPLTLFDFLGAKFAGTLLIFIGFIRFVQRFVIFILIIIRSRALGKDGSQEWMDNWLSRS
jgi:hypothetical protein